MSPTDRTALILLALAVALLIWDIALATDHIPANTISAAIHAWGSRSWFVLIGIGVLIGHFFWPMSSPPP
ncbi:MAG: hypothetical protein HRU00_17455 [Myxococcales bacterium]|nr:hypothetical protein [Myxococcales bacterium]